MRRVAAVAYHRLALPLAGAAFFGALGHVLVIRELFTGFGAALASFGTSATNRVAERPAARNDAVGGGTNLGTVQASLQRLLVFFLAFGKHAQAVPCARVARALTGPAGVGTLVVRPGVRCSPGLRRTPARLLRPHLAPDLATRPFLGRHVKAPRQQHARRGRYGARGAMNSLRRHHGSPNRGERAGKPPARKQPVFWRSASFAPISPFPSMPVLAKIHRLVLVVRRGALVPQRSG